jgi:FkbM family methyltransferase
MRPNGYEGKIMRLSKETRNALVLRPLTRHIRIPIATGPNKGLLWSVATSSNYLIGTYEKWSMDLLASLVVPGDCFWDAGAHYGYASFLAERRNGLDGRVYAFEPSETNGWYLNKHIVWNNSSVQLFPIALSDNDRTEVFRHRGSGAGRLKHVDKSTEATVRETVATVRSIDSMVASGECLPPTVMKVDVEGSEADLFRGGANTLRKPNLLILVSTHSLQLYQECKGILHSYDLEVIGFPGANSALLAIGRSRNVPKEVIQAFVPWCRRLACRN